MSNTGLKIKKIRELRNYTQAYMAEQLGLEQSSYSKIENSISRITVEQVMAIAKVLEIPVEELLNGDANVFNVNNNHVDKFYANIENMFESQKEVLEKTIDIMQQQMEYLRNENQRLLNIIDSYSSKK